MEGNPLAKCPLKGASDNNNYLYLTDKQFIVKISGKMNVYEIDAVKFLHWKNKKLLLPIVLGGLSSSLSVFAYMNDLLHPWIMLLFLISGILLLYYGFTGTPALVLNMGNAQDHYLLRSTTVYLEHFINFFNRYIQLKEIPHFYLTVSNQTWDEAQNSGYITVSEPLRLYETIPDSKDSVIVKISIDSNQLKISYLPIDQNNGLIPCVTDHIPLTAVSTL